MLLIEPTDRPRVPTSGGLGQTDIGNKAAIGGLSRRARRVREYYRQPDAWKMAREHEVAAGDNPRRERGNHVDI